MNILNVGALVVDGEYIVNASKLCVISKSIEVHE